MASITFFTVSSSTDGQNIVSVHPNMASLMAELNTLLENEDISALLSEQVVKIHIQDKPIKQLRSDVFDELVMYFIDQNGGHFTGFHIKTENCEKMCDTLVNVTVHQAELNIAMEHSVSLN